MAKKLVRLKKRADFLRISSKKCSCIGSGFIIQADINPNISITENTPPDSRVGFTVSKKVGNAVKRNFVKRRLRSLADSLIRDNFFSGIDYVIIGRKEAIELKFADMKKSFEKNFLIVSKKIKEKI